MIKLNKLIDHTLLKPEATSEQIQKLIEEAKTYDFASVMVNSCHVAQCAKHLTNTDVKIATVIGFPLGACNTATKVAEVQAAKVDGANEFDMVLNIGKLKEGDYQYVTEEIKAVKQAVGDVILKVIIEACLLTEDEKIAACKCVSDAKADYIKTSTGFSSGGATVEDVALLRKHTDPAVKVKAAGGIRDMASLQAMLDAGAMRIGTSSGVALMQGESVKDSY